MSYTQRVTNSAIRSQLRQPAIRTNEEPGKKVTGDISKEVARLQQSLKYLEDKKKFTEKEKEKADKKRKEKWEKYRHVDIGQRLNSNSEIDLPDENFMREEQQMMYEIQSKRSLDCEKQKEAARSKREKQKRKEKLEKYAHVSVGLRLNDGAHCSRAEYLQDINEVLNADHIEEQSHDINLNITTNRVIENSHIIENAPSTFEETVKVSSSAEKEEMFREQMRRARERMQQKYDEHKNKIQ